ncbi:competence protein CoiA family protein [Allosalinactinospora lopnorensis]|uniref:hypothetical protein n=1 Tax=Allosalinactinospora lopnorensis TaxID=1352348 RepID=UPI000623C142|nr:hypothetical protein [Allosalinactinospora lopnorensis]
MARRETHPEDDHRLVQTAVVGRPRSEVPVSLPMDESGAQSFRLRNKDRTFWCGTLLGGCGGRLSDKIYREKVCHFAHHPSSNGCTRRHGGVDSADHLYASRKVNRWLQQQGWDERPARYEGEFAAGGTCVRVLLGEADGLPPICVEFSRNLDAYLKRLLHAGEINRLDWLVKENPPLTGELIDRNGYALRIRFKDEDLGRGFEVGTMTGDLRVRWNDLSECSFTREGIRTPVLKERRLLRLTPAKPKPPAEDTPERLRRLVRDALDNADSQAAGRAIDAIARQMSNLPGDAQKEFRAKLIDLQKVKDQSAPRMVAERLLKEWHAATKAGQSKHAQQLRRELRALITEPGNGLTPEQRRRIFSDLDSIARRVGGDGHMTASRLRTGTVPVGERVDIAVHELKMAVLNGDRARIARCREQALALRKETDAGITAAHRKKLDRALAKTPKTAQQPSPGQKKRNASSTGHPNASTRAEAPDRGPHEEPAPDSAAPDSSSGMDETLRARSEEIRRQLRREGRTPAPPSAGAARETGEGSSDATADAGTLRRLAAKINSRRLR